MGHPKLPTPYDRESRLVEWQDEEEWELKGPMMDAGLLGAV